LSLAEALASGVPAIVTPGINLAGDIEKAGAGWVVERSVGALADGLRKAAADVKERQRRGAAARRWADRFRWPVVAQRLSAVYEGLSRPAVAAAPTAAGARNFT
jgi:glycosyltransferase involved in cell wall biosynthesis